MRTRLFDAESTEDEFVLRIHRKRILTEETREHLRAAEKDVIHAARSVLDAMLSSFEKRPADDTQA